MSTILILLFVLVFAGPARLWEAFDQLVLTGLRGWKDCFCKWFKALAEKKTPEVNKSSKVKFTDKSEDCSSERSEKKSKVVVTDADDKPLN